MEQRNSDEKQPSKQHQLQQLQQFQHFQKQSKEYENYQQYEKMKSKKLNSPPPTKLRSQPQQHINQHIFIKNKLYNLNEQNSKHFFEKSLMNSKDNNSNQNKGSTNRFEDLYDNQFMAFPNKTAGKSFSKNGESTHKRRSAHLFNL